MTTKSTGRKPPTHSPTVEALLAEERVVEPQPSDLRERLLLRARQAQLMAPPVEAASAVPRRYGPGTLAAAGFALVAAVSAALLLSRTSKTPTPAPRMDTRAPASQPSEPLAVPVASAAAPVASPTRSVELPESPLRAPMSPEPSGQSHRALQSKPDSLSEELQLLSRARQADAHGDFTGVLATLAEHERSYPAGRLSEEREVLRVKALVALGRLDEARRAGARFARRFPRSVLVPKVNEMLGSPP